MKIAQAILLLCLAIVFFQDWKFRKIHVVLPLVIFAISFFMTAIEKYDLIEIAVFNAGFFLTTLSILTIYMSVKSKRFLNPFLHYFGLGDLLFYMAITPLFLLKNWRTDINVI